MRRDTEDIIKKAMEDSAKEIHDLELELDEAIDLETASADRVELKPDEEVGACRDTWFWSSILF